MGRETVLFKSKEMKSAKEVADILRLIADKMDGGTMTLNQGESEVSLEFPSSMKLQLKVETEEGRKLKKKFEVELEWTPGEDAAGGPTVIS